MSISIRERKLENGRSRLTLSYYHKGRRWVEKLELIIYDKPKTKTERDFNKTSMQLAEAIRGKRLVEQQNGKYGFNNIDKLKGSFRDYFKKSAEKRRRSLGSYGNWKSAYGVFVKFMDGKDVTFEEVTTEFLEKFKKYLLEARVTKSNTRLARNSALSYFNKLKAALNDAFEERIMPDKIAPRVKSIKEEETHREYLTLEEINKLIHVTCEVQVLKNAFLFSTTTGLRWSDVYNLTWRDVEYLGDSESYQLRYIQQKTRGAEVLPISNQAVSFIGERGDDNARVFKGLRYSAWYNLKLQQWVMKAGINKNITFHCARHTYATLMLTHNVDIFTVSKLLGHKDIKTTQIYAKVIDQRKIDAVNQFPKFDI
jgi:integrase